MDDFKYAGTELELFAEARNWKSYWANRIRPFVKGDVLEVGAGIGTNTVLLNDERSGKWLCLEPDASLVAVINEKLAGQRAFEAACGTLSALDDLRQFDTILYIDVLEHIENDREEIEHAASRLRHGGRLIVLSPAHHRLFAPFDAAIGHYRRYNRAMLRNLSPAGTRLEQLFYLDSLGLLLSAGNKVLLRQAMPTKAQILFWDRVVIPVSRVLDRLLFESAGRSIVGIWRRY